MGNLESCCIHNMCSTVLHRNYRHRPVITYEKRRIARQSLYLKLSVYNKIQCINIERFDKLTSIDLPGFFLFLGLEKLTGMLNQQLLEGSWESRKLKQCLDVNYDFKDVLGKFQEDSRNILRTFQTIYYCTGSCAAFERSLETRQIS